MKHIMKSITVMAIILLLASLMNCCQTSQIPEMATNGNNNTVNAKETGTETEQPDEKKDISLSIQEGESNYYDSLMEEAYRNSGISEEERQKEKEKGIERYENLQEQLREFDRTHDLDSLDEAEAAQRIELKGEIMELYDMYISEPVSFTDEEMLKQFLSDYIIYKNAIIDLQNSLAKAENPDHVESLKEEITGKTLYANYLALLQERFRAGEDAGILLREHQRFDPYKLKNGNHSEWIKALQQDAFWNELWNNGELIEISGTD